MKKLITIAAIATLAACSQEKAEDTEATEDPVEAVTNGGVAPGIYEVTTSAGQTVITDLRADGTFADIVDGKDAATGKWTTTANQVCFDGDAEGQEETCWKNSPANADGSWTATNPDGDTVTISPVAAEA